MYECKYYCICVYNFTHIAPHSIHIPRICHPMYLYPVYTYIIHIYPMRICLKERLSDGET